MDLLPLMLLAFLITIGILVTVHEWGHFWVAKRLGVKILRFSVGFGPALWKRRFGADNTEFVLAAVPLGGYVQMLDEREGEVAEAEVHRAFNRQSLKVRSAVVLAGPLANFVFAFFALMLLYMLGIPGHKPIVFGVVPDSLAEKARFQGGDEILAINGSPTLRWQSVSMEIINSLMNKKTVQFTVLGHTGTQRTLLMDASTFSFDDISKNGLFSTLGMKTVPDHPKISEVTENSPAQRGGILAGDIVIRAADQEITSWQSWTEIIQAHPGRPLILEVERNAQRVALQVTPDNKKGKGFLGVAYKADIIKERYTPLPAANKAVLEIKNITIASLRLIKMMLTLEVSVQNINGPVTIAEVAGKSMHAGGIPFLWFLAMISISLGIVNLLPIPVLDGGHLLTYLFEAIKGGPLSEQFQFVMMRVGLALLIMLMGLALFNDINRLLH